MTQTLEEIKAKIRNGHAHVFTADEVHEHIENGDTSIVRDIDVVTTGTRGIMSGTYAVLSFPIAAPGIFDRASKVSINGVPAIVGPCPNERLGILDLMVFGTAVSEDNERYNGGQLFRELIEGRIVTVELTTDDGKEISKETTLDKMPFAKMMATRNTFRNYRAIVNLSERPIRTIFHAIEFQPKMMELTFSGCGHLNPLQNDPELRTIGIGTRVLVNGSEGFVTGTGTRSTATDPNLMMIANMKKMSAEYVGSFMTSAGPECAVSWAVPIPVLNETMRRSIGRPDREIPLPIADIADRKVVGTSDYGEVWDDVGMAVRVHPDGCMHCERCDAEEKCPTQAINFKKGKPAIERYKCFNCGLCTTRCEDNVFEADLGRVNFTLAGKNVNVPVVCRQSDKVRASKLAKELKKRILDGSFVLTQMVERLYP